ncbi:Cyclic AMP receptor-like A-like protein [Cladobotryum mycophilum]|uniref:Cyclic AMP receptor-like A-like protein n=1 Tax=Cladobotryum mycophilum TaxID=491253 RepID=A0ABR0T0J4_9HYPO
MEIAKMGPGFWAAFWILFVLCVLTGFKLVFRIQFYGYLILMRATNNQMPKHIWVAFWLCFWFIYGDLFFLVQKKDYKTTAILLAVVRFFIRSDYEMPALVFWIIVGICAISFFPPTMGSFVCYGVVLFSTHIERDGIHLPGVLVHHFVITALVAVLVSIANLLSNPGYFGAVLVFFATAGILRNQMWPYNEEFGFLWMGAWWLLLQAIMYAFAPNMKPLWYVMQTTVVVGLGVGCRPDESLGRFILWAVTIMVFRFASFFIYTFYILGGMSEDLFPFNLFSDKWRKSKPSWFPLSSRDQDSLNEMALCERCDHFTSNSKLIMGSPSYFTQMVEWHDFWSRAEFSSKFETPQVNYEAINQVSALPEPPCRLCCLLWYSMSSKRQQAIEASGKQMGNIILDDTGLPSPQNPYAELRIKVWEERPLSLYTYMQLFWGDIPIGARLLVHRSTLFATPSPAVQYNKTGSTQHFEQARKWLNMCKESHKVCQSVGNTKLELPKRMLYVRGGNNWMPGYPPECLKLVESCQTDSGAEYLAFSHCWGPTAEMRFKLLASNIDSCYEGIDFAGLSQNVQDAITTTIALGFSYIWIDSLCIIQRDDRGKEVGEVADIWKKDWEVEAKKMGSVYSGAACTIASTGSPTSSGGCFHERNANSLEPCKVGVSSPHDLSPEWIYARRDDVFDYERSVDLAPLNTRGWVMQERLLSRRILHFGSNMIYWECCGRSASELNPHGYTYKKFPEDFEDNYAPDTKGYMNTRGDVMRAEQEGRGFSWAAVEKFRRRPPPVTIEPDSRASNQIVWQHKRGFWKNVLKPSEEPWSEDEKNDSRERPRAGFRAAFEQLREGVFGKDLDEVKKVGRDSFSQLWYDLVESYSRGKLTSPMDKLMALKGIEDEIARATKFTYVYGLWKQRLLTDLLWFAIDGLGKRLLTREGLLVAPTWSWASIGGVAALDLLPENSLRDIEKTEALASVGECELSSDDFREWTISITAPLLPISTPTFDGTVWNIDIGNTGKPSARFFPDIEMTEAQMTGLVCLSFLVLHREKSHTMISASSEDVQGLVLRHVIRRDRGMADVYERVGYFTSYIEKSKAATEGRKALKKALGETAELTNLVSEVLRAKTTLGEKKYPTEQKRRQPEEGRFGPQITREPTMGTLTEGQFKAIDTIERVCSSLSLLGCLFTITTFCASREFNKPINRLVFYASIGNTLTNVGTMMTRTYVNRPNSFGCQLQGLIIQTFMPADAYWTLAMAINVYLTFYHQYEPKHLRKMESTYLLCCYGIPLVPGIIYLFVKDRGGQRIYGNAVSWCWVASDWDVLRVVTFYGPVWVVSLITFSIYIRAGREIYKTRKEVQSFQSTEIEPIPTNDDTLTVVATTGDTVTMETMSDIEAAKPDHLRQPHCALESTRSSSRAGSSSYASRISADSSVNAYSSHHALVSGQRGSIAHNTPTRVFGLMHRQHHELNNAAWTYTKCAILFFTAMLITWIPSSANRVYSLVHNKTTSIPLEFMSVLVLPLQGFWNALIYVVISWTACKNMFRDISLWTQALFESRLERFGVR